MRNFICMTVIFCMVPHAYAADGMFFALRSAHTNVGTKYSGYGNRDDSAWSYKIALGAGIDAMGVELEFSDISGVKMIADLPGGLPGRGTEKNDIYTYFFNITQETEIFSNFFILLGVGGGMAKSVVDVDIKLDLSEFGESDAFTFYANSHHAHAFAWNISAGIGYMIIDGLSLDLLYRYTDIGKTKYKINSDSIKKNLNMHEIIIGVKCMF